MGGTGYLVNEHFNRVHNGEQLALNREQQILDREQAVRIQQENANLDQRKLELKERQYNDIRADKMRVTQSWWGSCRK
jgi:hypothetical protein